MARTVDDDSETCKLAAALVYVEEHRRWKQAGRVGPPPAQAAVAARLAPGLRRSISQSTVSRWLRDTENRYWRRDIQGLAEAIEGTALLVRARDIAFPANIATLIRSAVPESAARRLLSVHSVPAPAGEAPGDGARSAGIAFARAAKGRVIDLLSTGDLWGVTWGHNVACVIDEIVRHPAGREEIGRKTRRVVPLCGDPFDRLPTHQSSSVLAEQLDVYLSGSLDDETLSLRNVPSYIPSTKDGFTVAEIAGIKKFVLRCKAYRKIFGVGRLQIGGRTTRTDLGKPLAAHLDGILTSVSSNERTFFYGPTTMIPMAKTESKWLSDNAFDIGGVCLARSSSNRKGDALLERLRVQWTGITLEQLEACAERACRKRAVDSPPGVVVVAIGVHKAASVAECLKRGLISHLLCSADLAAELEKLFKAKM